MPKQVHLSYFAILKEERGIGQETVLTETSTIRALFQELRAAHSFSLDQDNLKACLNEAIVPWNSSIQDNDRIAFIPPVSGG